VGNRALLWTCAVLAAGCVSEPAAVPVLPAALAGEPPATPKPAAPPEPAAAGVAASAPVPADEPAPEGPAAEASSKAPPDAPPEPPAEPRRVLLLGDSLAATGFGALLERRLDAHPHVDCFRRGKSASGLARPDFFDWMAEGPRHAELRDAELVVVILGGNDGQDLTGAKPGRKRVAWASEEWPGAYQARVRAFLERIAGEERAVLWLGLPRMGAPGLERKLEVVRTAQRDAVEGVARASYVETTPFVVGDDGELLSEVRIGRKMRRLREEDGVHFTMEGSEYLADRVYPVVLNALGLQAVAE
jgi:hypothetical protein